MDNIARAALLYDFYGELLTEHQKEVYEEAVFNDLSLSEIAESYDISRQAAHDLIRRCTKTLESYEEKLHLAARFSGIKHHLEEIREISEQYSGTEPSDQIKKICITCLEEI